MCYASCTYVYTCMTNNNIIMAVWIFNVHRVILEKNLLVLHAVFFNRGIFVPSV